MLITLLGSTLWASSFVEIPSSFGVQQSAEKIIEGIKAQNGFTLFAIVDHQKNAKSVALEMPETLLIIFGNKSAGTALMNQNPLMGYELPLKILISHKRGRTIISYRDPAWYVKTYGLSSHGIIAKMDEILKNIVATCL